MLWPGDSWVGNNHVYCRPICLFIGLPIEHSSFVFLKDPTLGGKEWEREDLNKHFKCLDDYAIFILWITEWIEILFSSEKLAVEGSIQKSEGQTLSSPYGVKKRSAASKFLENRGFGWLTEEEELDEEDQKPLL